MSAVALKPVGSIALVNLIGMSDAPGDGVPYPLWRTRREPYWGAIQEALLPFADRFDGEFASLREWAETYARAEIWVECRVNTFADADESVRLLAYRAGDVGYIAIQRPTEDIADVYRLCALDIGPAVAGLAGLSRPGDRRSIAVPGFLDNFTGAANAEHGGLVVDFSDDEDYRFSVRDVAPTRAGSVSLDYDDVIALGTIQSHCTPLQTRGVDWGGDVAVWVRVNDDGDYIFATDRERALPVDAQALGDRVDQLIAADVATVRRRRGLA